MPATSQARILANRQNSLRSTGPTSTSGKERSRQNSLKHGLTGKGIVLAEQDRSEAQERAEALMNELNPRSTLGKLLVGQIATLSVKMERGARREEEAIATRVRHAAETFDNDRIDSAEIFFNALAESPREYLIELKRSPEGVDRLVEAWAELRDVLGRGDYPDRWEAPHQARLAHLTGRAVEQVKGSRDESLSLSVRAHHVVIDDPAWQALDPRERRLWARDRLIERIDAEIAALEEHRATFDFEAIELDRRGSADLALFDPSREGTLARRYESEARRGFFRAINEFRRAEAEFEAVAEATPEPETAEPLASSGAKPSPTPREPEPSPLAGLKSSIKDDFGVARGLDGRVLAVARGVVLTR